LRCASELHGLKRSPRFALGTSGKPAIPALVDEFVTRVAPDKCVSGFFAGVARDPARLAGLKSTLVDLICEAGLPICRAKT
jgi:hypothetical protein